MESFSLTDVYRSEHEEQNVDGNWSRTERGIKTISRGNHCEHLSFNHRKSWCVFLQATCLTEEDLVWIRWVFFTLPPSLFSSKTQDPYTKAKREKILNHEWPRGLDAVSILVLSCIGKDCASVKSISLEKAHECWLTDTILLSFLMWRGSKN